MKLLGNMDHAFVIVWLIFLIVEIKKLIIQDWLSLVNTIR